MKSVFTLEPFLPAIAWLLLGSSFVCGQDSGTVEVARTAFEIVSVEPSNFVLHGLETQSLVDGKRLWTRLRGPRYFSRSVTRPGQADEHPNDFAAWYEISQPIAPATKTVRVEHPWKSGEVITVKIGDPAFFLSPSRHLVSGPPVDIPADNNLMKAYAIEGWMAELKTILLENTWGKRERKLGNLLFVCVPCEEWHHDEHLPIKDADRCLLVFDVPSQTLSRQETIIDQFGLNQLTVTASNWIGLESRIIQQKNADVE